MLWNYIMQFWKIIGDVCGRNKITWFKPNLKDCMFNLDHLKMGFPYMVKTSFRESWSEAGFTSD